MSSLAYEVGAHDAERVTATDGRYLLRPSEDGWVLIGPDGRQVFEALGAAGRRRCLQFARATGVLAVFS